MKIQLDAVKRSLFKQIDCSSLVFFRIAFGGILLWEVCRYFYYGWIERYWIRPDFYFTYDGFHWIEPWGGNGMYLHFAALGILSFFIMTGLLYRISAALFFLGFTYIFLLDKANYLNHFYLISLISFLMILVPANASFSLDARLFPKIKSETIPAWSLYLIIFQVSVAYFYGGIAKLNADWLAGEPMRKWLGMNPDFPLIGQYFKTDFAPMAFSYGGLLFDLLIVPMLLFRRTRWMAVGAIVLFHLINSKMFSIGIFPWFMIASAGLFFPPDWFRRFVNRLPGLSWSAVAAIKTSFSIPSGDRPKLLLSLLMVYGLLQLTVPLRHLLIPGNVSWTEEGHRFAWHMKLRDKQGSASFVVKDPVSELEWTVYPRKYLSRRQARKMETRPDMILQFSHYLAGVYANKGYPEVEVRAVVMAELNSRNEQFLIDPEVNLANVKSYDAPAPWIMPLLSREAGKLSFQE